MKKIIGLLLLAGSAAVVAAPPPGHPTVDEAAKAMNLPRNPNLDHLPNQGVVVQAIPSNDYVYVEYEQEGARHWLAAPAVELAPGAHIRFSNGTVMRNFYSKKQQRTFAEVLFVSRVEAISE